MKNYILLFVAINYSGLFAQSDSLKNYNLEEITVKSGMVLEPKSITTVKRENIDKADASSLIELGKYIPSIKIQINSRGESLFYLRGSSERQISLFFDGVPLNIPWDNRIDLSLIPTDAVNEITVTKGMPSVIYGANTPAGVVNVNSKTFNKEEGKFSLQLGDYDFRNLTGSWTGGSKKLWYLLSGSFKERSGYSLPDDYSNSNNPSDKRKNSYFSGYSIFGKAGLNYSEFSEISFSTGLIKSRKGVAPETDVTSPRFWKYPDWSKYFVTASGSHNLSGIKSSFLTYALSYSVINTQINQYNDISYSTVDDIEKGTDNTFYGRLIYTNLISSSSIIKISTSATFTGHEEKFLSDNYKSVHYSQNLISSGIEYEYIDDRLTAILGTSLDVSSTPKTGDKPSNEPVYDYSINSALMYSVNKILSANITFGRKTRFPTLRESFSGALGRFITNPDLSAETVYSFEAGLDLRWKSLAFDTKFFFTQTRNGIVRVTVEQDGIRKFKRVNKDKIRSIGLELISSYNISEKLRTNFNITLMNSFAMNPEGEYRDTLEYKPEIVSSFGFDYAPFKKLNLMFEVNYVGREFGLKEGAPFFEPLPAYLIANIRAAYDIKISRGIISQVYIRVNNIFDKLYYTQWSLPEAGREFFFGTNVLF
ncbi:MAG: TonB-dependent receptor [Melioribacteraceae bacterium]|nr:TonB-dependent receptor [Melioribacteraceae bacterium]